MTDITISLVCLLVIGPVSAARTRHLSQIEARADAKQSLITEDEAESNDSAQQIQELREQNADLQTQLADALQELSVYKKIAAESSKSPTASVSVASQACSVLWDLYQRGGDPYGTSPRGQEQFESEEGFAKECEDQHWHNDYGAEACKTVYNIRFSCLDKNGVPMR
eukprot:gnl/TRDRNA2_/TRDRNA2_41513_c0_seq1.p1 gnl/TRDRNA2_/TRDRNA2_41513_c0~~gnl/TRDRNA2_/TRDRNA2_41513_c0_seq1.p1  ORF type:complete len:167 (+),score=21.64 gnl/TRDRNA2_/TRDRNA2_41513_c0_seq1:107-607(+)